MKSRKLVLIVASSALLSIFIVALLYAFSDSPNAKGNGFIRNLKEPNAKLDKSVNIVYFEYYVAGAHGDTVYLGNRTAGLHILKINLKNYDTTHWGFNLNDSIKLVAENTQLLVEYPDIYLFDGKTPAYLKASIENRKFEKLFHTQEYFLSTEKISNTSFINRGISRINKNNILYKVSSNDTIGKNFYNGFVKQVDGFFCTDGLLSYDSTSKKVVYLLKYRNEFSIFDTSLNFIQQFHTIDTNSVAKFEVTDLKRTKERIFSTPKTIVNKLSRSNNNKLYVASGLLSDQENKINWLNSQVIDVYSLDNGHYKNSFYIPLYKKKKISDFYIYKNKLIAIADNYLLVYNLEMK